MNDPEIKEKIYNEYVKAFKTGVYNMIKTERVGKKISKRQYFSGGIIGLPKMASSSRKC